MLARQLYQVLERYSAVGLNVMMPNTNEAFNVRVRTLTPTHNN
jgi:hypothetical protein